MIFKSVKDVYRLFYACYSKWFRLIFQTVPQYDPAWIFYSASSLFLLYYAKKNLQKKALRLSFHTRLIFILFSYCFSILLYVKLGIARC